MMEKIKQLAHRPLCGINIEHWSWLYKQETDVNSRTRDSNRAQGRKMTTRKKRSQKWKRELRRTEMNYNEGIAGWCLAILWKCNVFPTLSATPYNCEMLLLHSAQHFVRRCFGFLFFCSSWGGGVRLAKTCTESCSSGSWHQAALSFFKTAETWERTLKRALKRTQAIAFSSVANVDSLKAV